MKLWFAAQPRMVVRCNQDTVLFLSMLCVRFSILEYVQMVDVMNGRQVLKDSDDAIREPLRIITSHRGHETGDINKLKHGRAVPEIA